MGGSFGALLVQSMASGGTALYIVELCKKNWSHIPRFVNSFPFK